MQNSMLLKNHLNDNNIRICGRRSQLDHTGPRVPVLALRHKTVTRSAKEYGAAMPAQVLPSPILGLRFRTLLSGRR